MRSSPYREAYAVRRPASSKRLTATALLAAAWMALLGAMFVVLDPPKPPCIATVASSFCAP